MREEQIARDLRSIRAVFFRPDKPFTWASGIQSPVYCDNRLTLTAPAVRCHVEQGLAELVKEHFPETEVLMGNDACEPVRIDSPAYALVERVIGRVFPALPCCPYVMTGGTDARFYQEICDACIRFAPVVYGPEQLRGMHGINENIEYACLPGAVDFYKNLIMIS